MRRFQWILACCVLSGIACADDIVLRDGDTTMTRDELTYIVRNWTPEMQRAGARDLGDRLELLNMALSSKKIAAEADKLTAEKDGDLYWKKTLMERAIKRKLIVDTYLREQPIPDMTAVAEEYYRTQKDRYARMPEQRLSSHILFKCTREDDCDRPAVREKAESVLAELNAGGSFEALAKAHSEDLRSGAQGGLYDRWLTANNKEVAPEYVKAVFALQAPGDYTAVTSSRFGFHIIRLEEIKPVHYRSFDDAKADIIADLEQEYRELSAKAFDARYRISDDASIDGAAMEALFAPYQTAGEEARSLQPGSAEDKPR